MKLYHPFTLRRLGWVFRRMHDKGLNVDERKMIRGGRNIEGSYFGYATHNFVDRDVYVEGDSPREASKYFDELWNSAEVRRPRINSNPAQAEEGRRILDDARQRLRARKGAKLSSGTDWGARCAGSAARRISARLGRTKGYPGWYRASAPAEAAASAELNRD